MANPPPTPEETEAKLSAILNKVLDERETKAAEAAAEKAKKDAEEEEKRRTNEPPNFLATLLGIGRP